MEQHQVILPDEDLIADANRGQMLLTDKRLYLLHGPMSIPIELNAITLVEMQQTRQLLVLLPGFVFAPLFLMYQSMTGRTINGFGSIVVGILVLGSLLRYYMFPERALIVNTADKSTRYLLRGADIKEVEVFVENLKKNIPSFRQEHGS